MRVIPKHDRRRRQRRRVRQTRFAHPAPLAAATIEAAKERSDTAPAERCAAGNAAVRVWLQDAATTPEASCELSLLCLLYTSPSPRD